MINKKYSAQYKIEKVSEYLLKEWKRCKEPFFPVFGSNLEITKEIEVGTSVDQMVRDYENDRDLASRVWRLRNELEEFFGKPNDDYWFFNRILDCSTDLIKNRFSHETQTLVYNGKKYTMAKGGSIQKFLGKIVKATENEDLWAQYEQIRIDISKISNQKRLKGILHLSINPMAYVTMSDNTTGWSSCMSWANCGCYRQGTVEMLNSENVFLYY